MATIELHIHRQARLHLCPQAPSTELAAPGQEAVEPLQEVVEELLELVGLLWLLLSLLLAMVMRRPLRIS